MYDNHSFVREVLYADNSGYLIVEMGERALIHLHIHAGRIDRQSWKNRKKILELCLRKLKMRGYREVIAKVPKDGFLSKSNGRSTRIERMLGFEFINEFNGWLYFRAKTLL